LTGASLRDNQRTMSDLGIILFTLRVAALTTLAIIIPALLLAALSWRAPARLRAVLDAFGALPLVLPPTAVGLILLELLSRQHAIGRLLERLGVELLFTPAAVVIACGVMAFPLMFTAFRVAIDSSETRYFDLARTLGASPVRAFLRVTLPLAWRGLVSGIVLGFCRAIGEFGATILLAGNIPGRTQTLSLAIYDRVQSGREEEAMPLLAVAVVIAFLAMFFSEALLRRQRRPVGA
jgi:molybdate transport system permease protein